MAAAPNLKSPSPTLVPLPRQQTHLPRHQCKKVQARNTRSCTVAALECAPLSPGQRPVRYRQQLLKDWGRSPKGVQKAIKPGWEVPQKGKLFFFLISTGQGPREINDCWARCQQQERCGLLASRAERTPGPFHGASSLQGPKVASICAQA